MPANYVNPPTPTHPEALPALPNGHTVHVDLVLLDRTIEVASGIRYRAWTFNGAIPGPVIRARVGDTIDVTLTNRATMGHSIDFHAALAPPNVAYQTVEPGKSLHFSWVARYPGVFDYHCGTPPVLEHISNGMYGAIIIDPPDDHPPVQSFVIVQSEFYPSLAPGSKTEYVGDLKKMESNVAEVVAFNGRAFQYQARPLSIRVGEPVRLYVVDAGPGHFSAFHVIGTILQTVLVDGNPANLERGVQTMAIPPGGGAVAEFTVYQAGNYPFVTHQFGDVDHGAIGVFAARDSTSTPPPVAAQSATEGSTSNAARGASIYAQNCSSCHGATGHGGIGPSLKGESARKGRSAAVAWIKNPAPPMPKLYPSPLSAQDVADVAAYVETL